MAIENSIFFIYIFFFSFSLIFFYIFVASDAEISIDLLRFFVSNFDEEICTVSLNL